MYIFKKQSDFNMGCALFSISANVLFDFGATKKIAFLSEIYDLVFSGKNVHLLKSEKWYVLKTDHFSDFNKCAFFGLSTKSQNSEGNAIFLAAPKSKSTFAKIEKSAPSL